MECESIWFSAVAGKKKQFIPSGLFLPPGFQLKAPPTTTTDAVASESLLIIELHKWIEIQCLSPTRRSPSAPYQACGPSCSCSSPPGIASHSRSGRPWCCKCWRSPSPSAWPCSPPRVEAGTSAEKDGSSSAEPLRAVCLWRGLSCALLMQSFDLVLSVYMVMNALLLLEEAIFIY